MNRPIEFRAYFKDPSGLVYFTEFSLNHLSDGYIYGDKLSEAIGVAQFTGLVDRHGDKIFEWDIIEDESYYKLGKVYFENGRFCWDHGCNWGEIDAKRVTVRGNIFENPELLEEK